jgi:hypothetical protein
MRIGQAGQNGAASQIHHARRRAAQRLHLRIGTDQKNASGLDRDGFGMRLVLVNGVDIPVDEKQIGRPGGLAGVTGGAKKKQTFSEEN